MRRAALTLLCAASAEAATPQTKQESSPIGFNSDRTLLEEVKLHFNDNALDTRFDAYGNALALAIKIKNLGWATPTAADCRVPTEMQKNVRKESCGLIEHIKVPMTDEHWTDVGGFEAVAASDFVKFLDFPHDAADCGHWHDGEDKIQTIQNKLVGSWPESRVLVPWGRGEWKYSDEALEQLVFSGMGQHRLQVVPPTDQHAAGAKYAVYLNFAGTLEVRKGFAKMGADAYFNADGHVTHIMRGGVKYTPDGPQGTDGGKVGWQHAKLAFRGTLNGVVTALDHLYAVHLTVANSIVQANVEELEPDHVLRRLMTPFGFRTEAINFQAAFALVNEQGLVHRAYPFSVKGLKQLWEYAKSEQSAVGTWRSVTERHTATGLRQAGLLLPVQQDGGEFYAILQRYVHAYLSGHYNLKADDCAQDAGVQRWWKRVNEITPNHDLPKEGPTCANLETVLASFMYYVSAGHNHVGTIAAEIEDPCFMPWAWREGELCGTPRTNLVQQITMASTGLEQPTIMQDYSHMFDSARDKQLWAGLTAELGALSETVKARNSDGSRPRPFRAFEAELIETAVGI